MSSLPSIEHHPFLVSFKK